MPELTALTLAEWRRSGGRFFFDDRRSLPAAGESTPELKRIAERILQGEVPFFHSFWVSGAKVKNWTTQPETGYDFGIMRHWTELESLDPDAGDIKYVWERARFSHLLAVMRYDRVSGEDHSAFILGEILDFIDKNPPNRGPNYVCSQEISVRIMNWLFLLYFYGDSPELTEERFSQIIRSIHIQLKHVYSNLDFSCIAVRNNHAITECAMLYIAGMLFPQFPEAARWKRTGLARLSKEVEYQIYPDGTHLQYSTNYHRVVLQVLTYVIGLAKRNGEKLPEVITRKFRKSIEFLFLCQDQTTGWLPNYGANDGALFFPLNDADFRDYRPQLDAAWYLIAGTNLYPQKFEDRDWFASTRIPSGEGPVLTIQDGVFQFPDGGIYLIRDGKSLTFFKCAAYLKNRPSHADDLHIDIWVDGRNLLFDGGSYKYNTGNDEILYFFGTQSHNTVMIDERDQMSKGPRFIWFDWVDQASCFVEEESSEWILTGEIHAFASLGAQIRHRRILRKRKGESRWQVTDQIFGKPPQKKLRQLWHVHPGEPECRLLSTGTELRREVAVSDYYGRKEGAIQIEFQSYDDIVKTEIELKKQ